LTRPKNNIAIAVDDLALEMVLIVLQFPLDVGELGIELVLLRVSGVLKIPVFGLFRHSHSWILLATCDATTYATRSTSPQGRKKSAGEGQAGAVAALVVGIINHREHREHRAIALPLTCSQTFTQNVAVLTVLSQI